MNLKTSDSWETLLKAMKEQFNPFLRRISFKRGEYVYQAGDQPKGLYFVDKGLVGLVILAPSGKEHLLRFFKAPQVFGHRSLFSQEAYHATTVALEETWIDFVSLETIENVLTQKPELYKNLTFVLAKELRNCEEQRVMVLENQILPRVAQALVYLKDLHPEHMWTRQEIANFCASTVSTVIKSLAKLEDMNLIRQDGRSIEILDQESLINLNEQI